MTFQNAAQAIEWIDGLRYQSEKNGLENMKALLGRLHDPQKALKCVHVAGTNGKGSTCAMLERMLRACGLKTGLYTSPYLMRYNERMRVCGVPIDDRALCDIASTVRAEAEALVREGIRPTWFELGTAIAFLWFQRCQVDVAIIEVGLGGRLDPTNVITPALSLIGPIDREHTKQLGGTLERIAYEKAGIIKPGVPCVVQRQKTAAVDAVFRQVAAEKGSPWRSLTDVPPERVTETARGARFAFSGHDARIGLAGRHQIDNACLALAGLDALRGLGWSLDERKAMEGLGRAVWPGRLEWLDPGTLIDGAHNAHGARALSDYVRRWLRGRPVVGLVGMMRDKDVDSVSLTLAGCLDRAVATQVSYGRAMPCQELAARLSANGLPSEAIRDQRAALERARALAGPRGVVLICGSLYLVGDMRLALNDDGGVI